MLIYYFLAIFSAFMQSISPFLWWPAVVVVVAGWRNGDAGRVYFFGFLAGLLTDLVTGKLLGQSSIFFLLIGGAIYLVKSRFEFNWRWGAAFVILSQVLFKLSA